MFWCQMLKCEAETLIGQVVERRCLLFVSLTNRTKTEGKHITEAVSSVSSQQRTVTQVRKRKRQKVVNWFK